MVLAIVALYLAVGTADYESAQVTEAIAEEEESVRAVAVAGAAVAALYADQAPATQIWLMNPICPDQWIAQRGASERWRVRCVLASTEGSRVAE